MDDIYTYVIPQKPKQTSDLWFAYREGENSVNEKILQIFQKSLELQLPVDPGDGFHPTAIKELMRKLPPPWQAIKIDVDYRPTQVNVLITVENK